MVLLDLQVMNLAEGHEARLTFGASIGNSDISLLLCHDED
ncbi:SapB/AmfS family lanthipeptide [Streptomyces cinnamoneus]|uniref:SapB/AmfS family lantipeptide n=1 Tax=Streptomyces cinnamoneus TaxID=53446 RepID=A0A918U1B1_STRCJ|nr:SapB/AmfS family lanthipeptide [Streptomyces cinnamoneus]GHC70443.1 hypothetical protein GCM10010507_56560 [Streptomyces cinnamoneus]